MKRITLFTLCMALSLVNTMAGVFEDNMWLAKSYHCPNLSAPPADNWE